MYFGLFLASFMYVFVYVFFVYGTQVSRRDSYVTQVNIQHLHLLIRIRRRIYAEFL